MIQACLNGRRTRAEHPAIPLTPEELAREGKAAVAAGAASLHVHPRGVDGHETLEAEPRAAVLRALREACPGTEISFTTGFWITNDAARRLELVAGWTELPDVASVNISEPGAVELIDALIARGIGIELGLATAVDTRLLVACGVAARCSRLLVELEGTPSEAQVECSVIESLLMAAGIRLPRMDHGYGRHTYGILDHAQRHGYDMRIGFEDTLVLPDGRPARSNAELVAAVAGRAAERSP